MSVTNLEPSQRAVVAVQHEHGQGAELSGAVPAVTTMQHHRLPTGHLVCYPDGSSQYQLEGNTQSQVLLYYIVTFLWFILGLLSFHTN